MKWTEARIISAIGRQVLNNRCLLLVDNCNWTGHECDVLGVTNDLRIVDVEVKISRSDLKADAKKDKWWHRQWRWNNAHGPDQLRPHPPKVWKHYYALPKEIWKPELAESLPSAASGVLLLWEHGGKLQVSCERRAAPAKDAYRLSPSQAVDVARLANLRMWDARNRLESDT